MIKNLTKTEYYREKKIPQVTICRRLQPQQPVRNHLIESLPRLGTEFQKIKSQQSCQNKANLELANALKIIHQLEYELEIMTTKCTENEEELFLYRGQTKQHERQISRWEEKIASLESTIQKNEFTTRAKFESEKEHYYSIIAQYERRIEDMNEAYERLKNDREKQLQNVQKFHESNFSKTQIQMKEYQSIVQIDINNFKKELEKAIKENSSMRQKITDLETCNQQHLRELQRMNSQLTQANTNMKCDYEHRIMTLQTQLDLSHNKIKELYDEIAAWDNRFSKESNLWREEKINYERKYVEIEDNWRNNYNQVLTQKDKTIQQLNRKTMELNEKEKCITNLNEKIRRLERDQKELTQQKEKIVEDYERKKRQFKDNLELEYQNKMNELSLQYERNLGQQIFKAVDNEKRAIEQKHKSQILKYIETIRILEQQKLATAHEIRLTQQNKRKLQSVIDQIKIQVQYLNRANKQLVESSKSQIDSLALEYEHRMKIKYNEYLAEIERLKGEHGLSFEELKQSYQIKIKELQQANDKASWELKELEAKNKKLAEQYEQERSAFISKVQSFEVTIGRMKQNNENLVQQNKNHKQKLSIMEIDLKECQHILNEQSKTKAQLNQKLSIQIQNWNRLKHELHSIEVKHSQNIKNMQFNLFEAKRKESALSLEVSSLSKKVSDLKKKLDNAEEYVKRLQADKIELQRKISQKDINSQQRWQIIEADFAKLHKKQFQQGERLQKQLKEAIKEKQLVIAQMNQRVKELENSLIKQRNQADIVNINWQTKCKQLQQANKKLIKSSFTLQEIEKENNQKAANLKDMQKDIEKYVREIGNKDKQLNALKNKTVEYETSLNFLKADNVLKLNEIDRLENEIAEVTKQYEVYKTKVERDYQQISREKSVEAQEMKKWKTQLELLQKKLEEEQDKYNKIFQEKKKLSAKISQMQTEIDLQAISVRDNKIKATKQISTLENKIQQLQQKTKELSSKLERQINEYQQVVATKDQQIKNILRKVTSYESDFLQIKNQYSLLKEKYETEKHTATILKGKLDQSETEKVEFQKKIKTLNEQVQKLERESEKTERDICKIYEENDLRVDLVRNQIKIFYEKEIETKNAALEQIKKKVKILVEEEKQQSKKREIKLNEEKQRLYKQIYEKSSKITEIQIQYGGLQKIYEQVFAELQMYKRKWNKMFSEFNDNNEQLVEINFKTNSQYKTEDKRVRKVVKEFHEVTTTERTQKVGTTDNQTPMSQNSFGKNQDILNHSFKNVSVFSQHSHTQSNFMTGNNRVTPTLLSNSSVVGSRHIEVKGSSSDISVRLDCSSASSQLSKRH